jgi:hypothetical protein
MTPVILMGVAYGQVAGTVWNSIMYLTERKMVGTVIGLMSCLINISMVITPLVYGRLKDAATESEDGYYWATRLSSSIGLCGVLLAIWIYLFDVYKNDGVLSMSIKQRRRYQHRL